MLSKEDFEKFREFLDSSTTKANITKVALLCVIFSSLPFVALGTAAMGNTVQIFRQFDTKKKYSDKQIRDAFGNLYRQKLVEYVSDKNGVTTIRITQKGKIRVKSYSIDLITIKKPYKWDGKWRVVMFDLPIRYSKIRNSLRFKLKQLGFVQLQKSVWVYPYPCTDEILFIANYYKLERYIEIMTVGEMTNDLKLRKAFNLK